MFSDGTATDRSGAVDRTSVLFVLEQTLGHVTHGQNLRRLVPAIDNVEATFADIEFDVSGASAMIPGFKNWTIRAGLRARRTVARARSHQEFDAMFVHTQVPAVLLGRAMTRVPTVVSLDATPAQYDALGEHYAHDVGPALMERSKAWLNRRAFERAAAIVTWAEWTKQGLVSDYGVDHAKITVIPPGVDTDRWSPRARDGSETADGTTRILFVGGDLRRKGGDLLISAFGDLRKRVGDSAELHLVTNAAVEAAPGVHVHRGLTPNSHQLIDLYRRCDIFCLPTLGDCLPMVLAEAGATGLAIIASDVGAISDIVRSGDTGLLVQAGDASGLAAALDQLVDDHELRQRVAANALRLVRTEHDAATNAQRIADVIRLAASTRRSA